MNHQEFKTDYQELKSEEESGVFTKKEKKTMKRFGFCYMFLISYLLIPSIFSLYNLIFSEASKVEKYLKNYPSHKIEIGSSGSLYKNENELIFTTQIDGNNVKIIDKYGDGLLFLPLWSSGALGYGDYEDKISINDSSMSYFSLPKETRLKIKSLYDKSINYASPVLQGRLEQIRNQENQENQEKREQERLEEKTRKKRITKRLQDIFD